MTGRDERGELRGAESPESIVRSAGPTVVEIDRLLVPLWRASEFDDIREVSADPDAMRFVGDGTILQREDAVTWLEVTESNGRRRVGERVEDDGSITVIHAIEFGSPAEAGLFDVGWG